MPRRLEDSDPMILLRALLLSVVLLGLCTGCGSRMPGMTPVSVEEVQRPSLPPTEPEAFILGPGDRLNVKVLYQDELNTELLVDPAGRITFPYAGELKVGGLTAPQVAERLETKLRDYYVEPRVSVSLGELGERTAYVLGEVKTPGAQPLTTQTSMLRLIAMAGGVTENGDLSKVLLIREFGDDYKASVLPLSVKTGEASQAAMQVRRGDIVYVPTSVIADVEDFMTRLNNIISPIARNIISLPSVVDAIKQLTGETTTQEAPAAPVITF